ncbi:unnamed protein product [Amoebophrya sp. A25]|nr:unnamed protein product [Amoebophrya sp. A25]|eukprot:GSA25T00002418001.1
MSQVQGSSSGDPGTKRPSASSSAGAKRPSTGSVKSSSSTTKKRASTSSSTGPATGDQPSSAGAPSKRVSGTKDAGAGAGGEKSSGTTPKSAASTSQNKSKEDSTTVPDLTNEPAKLPLITQEDVDAGMEGMDNATTDLVADFFEKKFFVPENCAKKMGFTFRGSIINKLAPDTWAWDMGLRLGDEIVRVQTDFVDEDQITEIHTRKIPGKESEQVFFTEFANLSMKQKIVRLKRRGGVGFVITRKPLAIDLHRYASRMQAGFRARKMRAMIQPLLEQKRQEQYEERIRAYTEKLEEHAMKYGIQPHVPFQIHRTEKSLSRFPELREGKQYPEALEPIADWAASGPVDAVHRASNRSSGRSSIRSSTSSMWGGAGWNSGTDTRKNSIHLEISNFSTSLTRSSVSTPGNGRQSQLALRDDGRQSQLAALMDDGSASRPPFIPPSRGVNGEGESAKKRLLDDRAIMSEEERNDPRDVDLDAQAAPPTPMGKPGISRQESDSFRTELEDSIPLQESSRFRTPSERRSRGRSPISSVKVHKFFDVEKYTTGAGRSSSDARPRAQSVTSTGDFFGRTSLNLFSGLTSSSSTTTGVTTTTTGAAGGAVNSSSTTTTITSGTTTNARPASRSGSVVMQSPTMTSTSARRNLSPATGTRIVHSSGLSNVLKTNSYSMNLNPTSSSISAATTTQQGPGRGIATTRTTTLVAVESSALVGGAGGRESTSRTSTTIFSSVPRPKRPSSQGASSTRDDMISKLESALLSLDVWEEHRMSKQAQLSVKILDHVMGGATSEEVLQRQDFTTGMNTRINASTSANSRSSKSSKIKRRESAVQRKEKRALDHEEEVPDEHDERSALFEHDDAVGGPAATGTTTTASGVLLRPVHCQSDSSSLASEIEGASKDTAVAVTMMGDHDGQESISSKATKIPTARTVASTTASIATGATVGSSMTSSRSSGGSGGNTGASRKAPGSASNGPDPGRITYESPFQLPERWVRDWERRQLQKANSYAPIALPAGAASRDTAISAATTCWTTATLARLIRHCQLNPDTPLHPNLLMRLLSDVLPVLKAKYTRRKRSNSCGRGNGGESSSKKLPALIHHVGVGRKRSKSSSSVGTSDEEFEGNLLSSDVEDDARILQQRQSSKEASELEQGKFAQSRGPGPVSLGTRVLPPKIAAGGGSSGTNSGGSPITATAQSGRGSSQADEGTSSSPSRRIVVGSLRGQLHDLLWIFYKNGLPSESIGYVFNGDIVGYPGYYSVQNQDLQTGTSTAANGSRSAYVAQHGATATGGAAGGSTSTTTTGQKVMPSSSSAYQSSQQGPPSVLGASGATGADGENTSSGALSGFLPSFSSLLFGGGSSTATQGNAGGASNLRSSGRPMAGMSLLGASSRTATDSNASSNGAVDACSNGAVSPPVPGTRPLPVMISTSPVPAPVHSRQLAGFSYATTPSISSASLGTTGTTAGNANFLTKSTAFVPTMAYGAKSGPQHGGLENESNSLSPTSLALSMLSENAASVVTAASAQQLQQNLAYQQLQKQKQAQHATEMFAILFTSMLLHPESVDLNRGNYAAYACGLYHELVRKYGTKLGARLFLAFLRVYSYLPIATVVDRRVLVTQGGLSSARDEEAFLRILRNKCCISHVQREKLNQLGLESATTRGTKKNRMLDDVDMDLVNFDMDGCTPREDETLATSLALDFRWSKQGHDQSCKCTTRPLSDSSNSYYQHNYTFEEEALVERYLEEHAEIMAIVRSHNPCRDGVAISAGGALVSLFSACNYQGWLGNCGALLVVDRDHAPEPGSPVSAGPQSPQMPVTLPARPRPRALSQVGAISAGATGGGVEQQGAEGAVVPAGRRTSTSFLSTTTLQQLGNWSVGRSINGAAKGVKKNDTSSTNDITSTSAAAALVAPAPEPTPSIQVVSFFTPSFETMKQIDVAGSTATTLATIERRKVTASQLEVTALKAMQQQVQQQGSGTAGSPTTTSTTSSSARLDRLMFEVKTRLARLMAENASFLGQFYKEASVDGRFINVEDWAEGVRKVLATCPPLARALMLNKNTTSNTRGGTDISPSSYYGVNPMMTKPGTTASTCSTYTSTMNLEWVDAVAHLFSLELGRPVDFRKLLQRFQVRSRLHRGMNVLGKAKDENDVARAPGREARTNTGANILANGGGAGTNDGIANKNSSTDVKDQNGAGPPAVTAQSKAGLPLPAPQGGLLKNYRTSSGDGVEDPTLTPTSSVPHSPAVSGAAGTREGSQSPQPFLAIGIGLGERESSNKATTSTDHSTNSSSTANTSNTAASASAVPFSTSSAALPKRPSRPKAAPAASILAGRSTSGSGLTARATTTTPSLEMWELSELLFRLRWSITQTCVLWDSTGTGRIRRDDFAKMLLMFLREEFHQLQGGVGGDVVKLQFLPDVAETTSSSSRQQLLGVISDHLRVLQENCVPGNERPRNRGEDHCKYLDILYSVALFDLMTTGQSQ